MFYKWLISFLESLEDVRSPLLGPNLKGLYFFGLWKTGSRTRYIIYNFLHFSTAIFFVTQIIELYFLRCDLDKALSNFSLTTLSAVCLAKCMSCVLNQAGWSELVENISKEEVHEIKKGSQSTLNEIARYTKYARMITYSYWVLVFMTTLALSAAPILKYWTSPMYRENIALGLEPYPQILSSWFPFDYVNTPGYYYASAVQIVISIQGAAVIATFDSTAVTIMTFLKGQLILLRLKCKQIFESETMADRPSFMTRIIECHRHHNYMLKQHKMFNSLLSPVMFVYVLVCSLTICCSVVQFTTEGITNYQKLWIVQYTVGQFFQLLMYCWHANEVYVESVDVDRGIFASEWWKADVYLKRQILLLAGKLDYPLVLNAGPFSSLSVPTFISIIKGSYSFFALFSQMQESK